MSSKSQSELKAAVLIVSLTLTVCRSEGGEAGLFDQTMGLLQTILLGW